jgi:hypothetical protein
MKLVFGTHRRPSSATDSVRSESESLVNGAASQDARPDQVRQTPASRTMLVQPTTCLAPMSVTATADELEGSVPAPLRPALLQRTAEPLTRRLDVGID